MASHLCISVTFLDRRFHGRADGGQPEWPPSPLRLMQALVAANADQICEGSPLDQALKWFEQQSPPTIVAPLHLEGVPYCLSVPNNAMDLVGKAWVRGNYFGGGDSSPATHRTMKTVRPVHMLDGETVHYLWSLNAFRDSECTKIVDILSSAAQRIVALGWGIDLVVSHGEQIYPEHQGALHGERWCPTSTVVPNVLRAPKSGTLKALQRRHQSFINRMADDWFAPVEPLTHFNVVGYRRTTDPVAHPCVVFELRYDDETFCSYPQGKLVHIAGMVRSLAIKAMHRDPPGDISDTSEWVDRYVAGHARDYPGEHQQFSYLPLPSIGHPHADQSVRRVMVKAPVGDDAWLDHLAVRLAGQKLEPEPGRGAAFGDQGPPMLVHVYRDKVAQCYTNLASTWGSVTPVILPGHDDHKPSKTRKLIQNALTQSGIEQPCEFEWSAFSRFRKSFSAHKYDKDKRSRGYIRPDHLSTKTAVHLMLRFHDGGDDRNPIKVSGPIVIGAGRHCGLGLMAKVNNGE